jgi:hypothetical protein
MTTNSQSASRTPARTRAGLFVPIIIGAGAAAFGTLAILHSHEAAWLGLGKATRMLVAGLGLFVAIGTEWIVLRQKKLIGNGQLVEAIVDEVRSISWSKEHSAAYYHFFTQDRRVITSYCAIQNQKKERWSKGQKIMAIYDPARPARHVVEDAPWAVQWQAAPCTPAIARQSIFPPLAA